MHMPAKTPFMYKNPKIVHLLEIANFNICKKLLFSICFQRIFFNVVFRFNKAFCGKYALNSKFV